MVDVRSVAGDSYFFEESVNPEKIRSLLDNAAVGTSSSTAMAGKAEGMKYLLAMTAKGRDVSSFYADVVKNVVVKDSEVKKLVYMFLVRYADANKDCRELALMAINSFQRDQSDSNPLIRAGALRVMANIRVREIVPIQIMAVKKSAYDTSPYVRKVAAHACCKVFHLDPSTIGELEPVVTRLLADKNVTVLSSAVQAYVEIFPDRLDMIHEEYRKLVGCLPDMDEWGQVTTLNMLVRYARTQFTDPSKATAAVAEAAAAALAKSAGKKKKKRVSGFYSDEESEEVTDDEEEPAGPDVHEDGLDKDHKLLLDASRPLLASRNTGVVLAVAMVHHYLAPPSRFEDSRVGRALVRVMRNHREVTWVVLQTIRELAARSPGMFRSYLKDFFIASSEAVFVKKIKLDVLVSLAADDNAGLILREFTRYVRDDDKDFVQACITSVGRIAHALPDFADRCLRGLMGLVRTDNAEVVAGAVVVIRQLLQAHPEHEGAILRLSRMLSSIAHPAARSAIVWIVGEFQSKEAVSAMAPDALRQLAGSFRSEHRDVKVQILNLAAKVALRQPESEPVALLLRYVLELARFDLDYDLRDRARLLRSLILSEDETVRARAREVVLAAKPPPAVETSISRSSQPLFSLGSLSSLVGHAAPGYDPIPSWPEVQPDPTVRDPKPEPVRPARGRADSSSSTSTTSSSGSSDSSDGSTSSSSSSSSSGSSDDESSSDEDAPPAKKKGNDSSDDDTTDSDSSSDEEEEE